MARLMLRSILSGRQIHSSIIILMMGIAVFCVSPAVAQEQDPLTIYLFRHAEKEAVGQDPNLTSAGLERAQILRQVISEPSVTHLFSTNTRRTVQTIQPFSDNYEKEIEFYNPRELEAFADTLQRLTGVVIVVGHSNTTPRLVSLITGQDIPDLDEKEYDQLFIIQRVGNRVDGTTTLTRLSIPPFTP